MRVRHIQVIITVVIAFILSSCGENKSEGGQQGAAVQKPAGESAASVQKQIILFFGNSLTAGYGLEDPSAQAFPAIVQYKIDSAQLAYKVVNAGLSGETSADGKNRIGWVLKQKVDVFVLELGANDGLRGIPVKETIKNLQAIIDTVKLEYPEAKLVMLGMQVPPNMGADYASQFKTIFPQLAVKNKMALVPFLLDGVGGIPQLNQRDGIHPTAEGARIVASNVWKVLRPLLKQ
ncbi:MAG TPA: arylesterase [Chitinophagaceae bacterium]|nr:arylesterase [Chitinophagaceae bacterium]